MPCPHCLQEHPSGAKFCPVTGADLSALSVECGQCGHQIPATAKFCPYCGEDPATRTGIGLPRFTAAQRLVGVGVVSVVVLSLAGLMLRARFERSAAQTPTAEAGLAASGPASTPAVSLVAEPTMGATAAPLAEPAAAPTRTRPTPTRRVPPSPSPVPSASPSRTPPPSPAPAVHELAGTGVIRLTFDSAADYTPALAPDQQRLVYASKLGGYWHLMELDPHQLEARRQITHGNANYHHPHFTADGQQILAGSDLSGNPDIYLLDGATGEAIEHLVDHPAQDYAPYWLPDYSGFVFTSQRDGNDELYLGSLDGQPPVRLTTSGSFDGFATVSRDGTRLAFYSNRAGNYEIYTMGLGELVAERLTHHPARDADPVFSPDGGWVVFESLRTGNHELFAVQTDGAQLTNLTQHPANEYVPRFSPDGQWLLFQSDRDGNMELYRMPWELAPNQGGGSGTVTEQRVNEVDGATLVFIPAGEFLMGSDPETDPYFYGAEGPAHLVYLDSYWIYQTEVTNAMYRACVAEQACPRPVHANSNTRDEYYGPEQFDHYPVVYVSWTHAAAYCRWAGGRLPTEAEWEKAARGADGRLFPWGNQAPSPVLANYGTQDTTSVGSFPEGASVYGVLDMAGNVIEWVFDRFQPTYYSVSPDENPRGPASGATRVYRGGSYHNVDDAIRVVMRGSRAEGHANVDIGFRCALD